MKARHCIRRLPLSGRSQRSGFTIVELMVAMLVMTVGVLGLATTGAVVARMVGGGAQQTIAANAAQSRFESLRSVQCNQITSGSASNRGVSERWTVQQVAVQQFDVRDSVFYTTRTGQKTQVYRSFVRC